MKTQNYKEIAHSRLTDRHRSDEAFLAILDTLIEIKDQRQNQYLSIADTFLDIDKSVGKNLDVIGRLIGEERTLVNFIDRAYFGFIGARLSEPYDIGYWYSLYKNKYGTLRTLTDEEYRRVLKARVVKNSSDNGRNSFLEVINILADNESSVVVEGSNNTAIEVRIKDEDGLVSYYLSKYKNDNNLIPVPLGRRLGVFHLSKGNICEPMGAEILPIGDSLSAGTYYINYKVNNGELKTRSFTINTDTSPFGVARGLFGYVSDDKGWRLFVLDGGNQAIGEDDEYHPAPFWSYFFEGSVTAAETMYEGGEEYINDPVTVEFISTPDGIGTDAVDLYFGQSTIVHACSYKTWSGA